MFYLAFIIDLILGEYNTRWHLVVGIGNLEKILEKILYQDSYFKGFIVWLIVVSFSLCSYIVINYYLNNDYLRAIFNIFIMYQCLCTKGLIQASNKVLKPLLNNDIKQARIELSYIVGRDPSTFNETKIYQALVETISENLSDGIIGVMFYYLILGVPGMVLYKAVNTMDSMIGYKNERYAKFGYVSAKMDDIFSLIPARISAFLLYLSSIILRLDASNALRIYKRDRYNHLSPNSAHPEAMVAGALHIQLGGPNLYHGKLVAKQYIGDNDKEITINEVYLSQKLLLLSSILMSLVGLKELIR